MSLARTHDPLSLALVRRLGDAGGPRADQVADELDTIIAWAKLSPRCIHRNTATVGNVGAGVDSLHSFSLPAGSLATNGDYLRLEYGGNIASGGGTLRRIITSAGGQTASDSGLVAQAAAAWRYTATYIRLTATTVRAKTSVIWGVQLDGVGDSYIFTLTADLTVADLNANATTLLVQCESSGGSPANNDITQNLSIIELTQQ